MKICVVPGHVAGIASSPGIRHEVSLGHTSQCTASSKPLLSSEASAGGVIPCHSRRVGLIYRARSAELHQLAAAALLFATIACTDVDRGCCDVWEAEQTVCVRLVSVDFIGVLLHAQVHTGGLHWRTISCTKRV